MAPSKNAVVENAATLGGFLPLKGDKINWSRWNLAYKRALWVYSRLLNLFLITEAWWLQKPPIISNLVIFVIFHLYGYCLRWNLALYNKLWVHSLIPN